MTRSVWLKADGSVGDWERRRERITAGLEAGVDWVLVDSGDVERVRELGAVNVAAFADPDGEIADDLVEGGDAGADDADEGNDASDGGSEAEPDARIVGKDGEGDGTVELPPDLSGSADLSTLRRADGRADGAYVRVLGEEYEAFAEAAASDAAYTIVVGEDWTIIPLENLIARIGGETELVAGVADAAEARTAFETLERGVDAVLLDSDDPDEIRRTVEVREETRQEQLDLRWATVTAVEPVGSADRVCVDTGSLMEEEEGMLVGSMSRGLFFVHAETAESPYVASRPFRVNAGAVHAYVRTPGGGTNYLAELGSGDEISIVDTAGRTRGAVVGRAKIEKRPMFRVEAAIESPDADSTEDGADDPESDSVDDADVDGAGDRIETLLQNAETIKVETRDGPRAVTDLEAGDELLVYYEETARHFGEAVEESIIEQ
jgi:3-dehydroquinate synthase II